MPKPPFGGKRCVNCGLTVVMCSALAGALPPQALTALHQWIPPSLKYTQEQLQKEPLCHQCFVMLESIEVIEGEEAAPSQRLLGHAKVCRMCGRSTTKQRRGCVALEPRVDNPKVRRLYDQIVAMSPKIFEHLKEVCRRCKRRAERALEKADAAPIAVDSAAEGTAAKPDSRDQSTKQQIAKESTKREELSLTKYRRVFVSKHNCAVRGCPRASERAPLTTRRSLMKQRVYLPSYARICETHQTLDNAALEHNFNTGKFTGEQIADMLFLMKPAPPAMDADNIGSMDPHLRRVWLGVTLDQFETLCEGHPKIPSRAIAVRLFGNKSGECAEVLASMFQLPLKDVNEALSSTEGLDLTLKDEAQTPNERGTENTTADPQYKQCMNNSLAKEAPTTPEAMNVDVETLLDQIMSE